MILSNLYRAIIDWAARPVLAHDNENELWRMSAHDLADLPIGPEPEDEGAAYDAARRGCCG